MLLQYKPEASGCCVRAKAMLSSNKVLKLDIGDIASLRMPIDVIDVGEDLADGQFSESSDYPTM